MTAAVENALCFSPVSTSRKRSTPQAPRKPSICDLTTAMYGLSSHNPSIIHESLKFLKRSLSDPEWVRSRGQSFSQHINVMLSQGLLDRVAELLSDDKVSVLRHEVAHLVNALASSGPAGCNALAGSPALLSRLIALLAAPAESYLSNGSRDNAALALAHLANESSEFRDRLLDLGLLGAARRAVETHDHGPRNAGLRCLAPLIAATCRRFPSPAPENGPSKPAASSAKSGALVLPTQHMWEALPAVARLLDSSSLDVLGNAAKAMSSLLQGGKRDRIEAALEAGIVPRLVRLCRLCQAQPPPAAPAECTVTLLCAVRALGRLCTGDDVQTRAVYLSGVDALLFSLLSHPNEDVRRDAAWMACNIAADAECIEGLVRQGVVDLLCSLVAPWGEAAQSPVVQEYCLRALRNMVCADSPLHAALLVQRGVHVALAAVLKEPGYYAPEAQAGPWLQLAQASLERLVALGRERETGWDADVAAALGVAVSDVSSALEMGPWTREGHAGMPPRFRAAARLLVAACALGDRAAACAAESDTSSDAAAATEAEPALGIWALPVDICDIVLEKAAGPRPLWFSLPPSTAAAGDAGVAGAAQAEEGPAAAADQDGDARRSPKRRRVEGSDAGAAPQ